MAVDTHAWDLPALDFFHLPFESDLPQDMFSFRDTEHDPVDTFPASMLTPPPISGSSSDDENFSFHDLKTDSVMETLGGACGIILGSDTTHSFSHTDWATPPASPPAKQLAAPASRFSFTFKQHYTAPESSSEEDFDVDSWGASPTPVARTPARRRKSTARAGKSRKSSKSAVSAALTAMTPERVSPEPPSYGSSDEMDEPENKRKSHNVLERKRRNDLKKSYQELRLQLPHLAENARAPTGHILTKAVEFIEELKLQETSHLQTIEDLKLRKARLLQDLGIQTA